ncbi:MAG: glycoside hydrolase [Thermoleophilia bacterium]|nr:glycoside hydrolase [Thermoleophilia bacterium]
MPERMVTYCVVHQPRRLRLPAQVIPPGTPPGQMATYLFDDHMNRRYFEKVARWCYYPATEMFLDMLDAGFKLSIGFSLSFLWQLKRWDRRLAERFRRLVAHPNCELVGVEPYHTFLFAIDIKLFQKEMLRGKSQAEEFFDKEIRLTDTTEMAMNNEIYYALLKCGYRAGMLDGRPWVMEWREPTHLYCHGGRSLALFCRHHELSDDVGYRFSNKTWEGYPLTADTYAAHLRRTWGDLVFIGWDFETFGEHHSVDTGIFEFMRALPAQLKKRGVRPLLPSEALEEFGSGQLPDLPLPEFGTTWAGTGGMEFFLGNPSQQAIFRLMHSVLNKAKLTESRTLLDLALWLLQSDNLHLIQWAGRWGSEAEVSAYFTPREWWDLGADRILLEQQRVYLNFIRAMDEYV